MSTICLTSGTSQYYSAFRGRTVTFKMKGVGKFIGGLAGIAILAGAFIEAGKITGAVQDISERQLPQLHAQLNENDTKLTKLGSQLQAVNSKLNDDVIPWVNKLKGSRSPEIKPAKFDSLVKQQEQLQASVAEVMKTLNSVQTDITQAGEENRLVRRAVDGLGGEVKELAKTTWRLEGASLQPELSRVVQARLSPITQEWESTANAQAIGQTPAGASGYIPAGVTLSTKPHVLVSVQDGVVLLAGAVPSEQAKNSVVEAVRGFRPQPPQVDAAGLVVQP